MYRRNKIGILILAFIMLASYSSYQFYEIGNYKDRVRELEIELKLQMAEHHEQLKLMEACKLEAATQRQIVDELQSVLHRDLKD